MKKFITMLIMFMSFMFTSFANKEIKYVQTQIPVELQWNPQSSDKNICAVFANDLEVEDMVKTKVVGNTLYIKTAWDDLTDEELEQIKQANVTIVLYTPSKSLTLISNTNYGSYWEPHELTFIDK